MQRRELFRWLAGAGSALGASSVLGFGRDARAFGEPPSELEALLPPAQRVQNVLELFLCGGVSQFESFYCVPEHGKDDHSHYHLYADSPEMARARETCALVGDPSEFFARDALDQDVHFGPFALPLRRRPDVLARTRVAILRHDLAPHEAAIPLALSGRSLGNPALAGLGAHVQRHFAQQPGAPAYPVSYVIGNNSLGQLPIDNLRALVATGLHPASARPLDFKIDAAGDLTSLLTRPALGARRAAYDALARERDARFASRLTWPDTNDALRAPAFEDFRATTRWLESVDQLSLVLAPESWQVSAASHCGQNQPIDALGAQLRLAARLLNRAEQPARYVCVVDGGFIPVGNGGGGYDSHGDNTAVQSRNLTYSLECLMNLIRAPGEQAPEKLDLSRTLIVLTSEFGRSPTAEGSTGRAHWPYGYPSVMLGGPIATAGISGACDASGYATHFVTPAQTRMAALLALGIWPFASEAFSVADAPGTATEAQAAAQILQRLLGLG